MFNRQPIKSLCCKITKLNEQILRVSSPGDEAQQRAKFKQQAL